MVVAEVVYFDEVSSQTVSTDSTVYKDLPSKQTVVYFSKMLSVDVLFPPSVILSNGRLPKSEPYK